MISFDLDMTLLDHATGRIPDSAMRGLALLKAAGYRIVLATGRDMDNHYSRKFRDLIRPDAIIHTNGTKISADGHLLFDHHFDRDLLRQVLEYCQQKGYAIGMTMGDDDYYVHPEVVERMDRIHWGICGRHFLPPLRMLELPIHTLAFVGTEDNIRDMEKAFPTLKFPRFSSATGADVIERGYSKADGLVRLAGYYGEDVSLRDSVAFGDSMNDIEMIRAVGTGVAMGNAIQALKDAADYVTDSIDSDGVWKALLHLGLVPETPDA